MNRRRFLAVLGAVPVALKTLPAAEAAPIEQRIPLTIERGYGSASITDWNEMPRGLIDMIGSTPLHGLHGSTHSGWRMRR